MSNFFSLSRLFLFFFQAVIRAQALFEIFFILENFAEVFFGLFVCLFVSSDSAEEFNQTSVRGERE